MTEIKATDEHHLGDGTPLVQGRSLTRWTGGLAKDKATFSQLTGQD